jgi:hypothetical protein
LDSTRALDKYLFVILAVLEEPEMVKPQPVIIISPRLPYRSEIVAIVPVSTTAHGTISHSATDCRKIITQKNLMNCRAGLKLTCF